MSRKIPAKRIVLPECVHEPSPPSVVRAMLDLAEVGPGDTLYDLGCGDGRIVIQAAQRGARAVGVDHDPLLLEVCRTRAERAGVTDRIQFIHADLFDVDLRDATVVTLFLTRPHNLQVRNRLFGTLSPGTRVISYYHDMRDLEPDGVTFLLGRPVYRWVMD